MIMNAMLLLMFACIGFVVVVLAVVEFFTARIDRLKKRIIKRYQLDPDWFDGREN